MAEYTLVESQEMVEQNGFLVCKGGTYQAYDFVEVYRKNDPDKKGMSAFHAGFIALGPEFYTNPQE
jgi:hypothetical protein